VEGNRALRYFVGFGAGRGKSMTLVKLVDTNTKQQVADFKVEGGLTMGAFGGDSQGMLNETGETIFKQVEDATIALCEGFERLAAQYNVPVVVQRVGSMFTIFFTDKPVKNFDDAASCNEEQFKMFFHHNLSHGIYYAPSPYESNFVSICHKSSEIERTLAVADEAFKKISDTLL